MPEESQMETPMDTKSTTTTTSSTTSKKSGSKNPLIIIVIALILICCCVSIIGAAIYFFQRRNDLVYTGSDNPGLFNPAPNGTGTTGNTGSTDSTDFSVNLPSGFPSDVPIYPGAKVLYGVKNDTDSYSASLTAAAKAGDVTAFYRSEVVKQGWEIKSEGEIFGYVITSEKGSRELNIVIFESKDDNGNPVQSITLSVAPKN